MADDTSSNVSASQSQLSSSSASRSSPSKLCSRTYKKASQLYLTRRLHESLTALEPVITPAPVQDEQYANGNASLPPVAQAPNTWRIKIWNLYITLLSAIVELGAEEGRKLFGQKEWKAISSQVRDGGIWETVVQTGYKGMEGSVDADVVYNLALLLLNHSPSQALNQQRLETYLSSYGQPNLDISEQHLRNGYEHRVMQSTGGTDTPKDLMARVRIIELFTLHVLPRNEEWEYAAEFINLSEALDEERKEVFLQSLDGLKEEKELGNLRAAAIQREKDAELERQARENERRRAEEAAASSRSEQNGSKRNGSEADSTASAAGAEKKSSHRSSKNKSSKSSDRHSSSSKAGSSAGRTAFSPPSGSSSSSKNVKKPEKPEARRRKSQALMNVLRNLVQYFTRMVSGNPRSLARLMLFILGLVMALSRQDVRERIQRITGAGWNKVKGTIGMGVKVSYI